MNIIYKNICEGENQSRSETQTQIYRDRETNGQRLTDRARFADGCVGPFPSSLIYFMEMMDAHVGDESRGSEEWVDWGEGERSQPSGDLEVIENGELFYDPPKAVDGCCN